MKRKSYQFVQIEEWEDLQMGFEGAPNFNQLLTQHGLEGWQIASVNYVERKGKLYRAVWLQREI
jgi:hypothetical protein